VFVFGQSNEEIHMVAIHVGLDYHSNEVQVCVEDSSGQMLANGSCPNDWNAIRDFAERHGRVVGAALEASTGAADMAEELVTRAGWSVSLAHPGYVSRMRQNPDKHDFGDARMLADLMRVGYLPRVWLAPQHLRELRRLVRYRAQLVNERRNIKLRIAALIRDHRLKGPGRRWTIAWMEWLRSSAGLPTESRWIMDRHLLRLETMGAEIREVERRLEKVTAADPVVQRLLKHPGIGDVTAWVLRAEIGDFSRFRSGKQLSRFCGVSPRNASSGARQADAGLIKAGCPLLRGTVVEAAHRLMRHDARWRALGLKLRARGKSGSVAAAAVANRWMRWMYHEMVRAA
jgi:transposase